MDPTVKKQRQERAKQFEDFRKQEEKRLEKTPGHFPPKEGFYSIRFEYLQVTIVVFDFEWIFLKLFERNFADHPLSSIYNRPSIQRPSPFIFSKHSRIFEDRPF